jgi:prepilin-type N-terminal cleavage/methylation domain-containing protein
MWVEACILIPVAPSGVIYFVFENLRGVFQMERVQTKMRRGEGGFTLVELAIVMIIIGLLITGVLKGQEMIANAQVSSTISQIKGYEAAINTFRDSYNAIPGDMANAGDRLPACDDLCAPTAADGNGVIGTAFDEDPGVEAEAFFIQMAAADLISGVNPASSSSGVWGESYPEAPIGGGFHVGYTSGSTGTDTNFPGLIGDAIPRRGHYVALVGTPDKQVRTTAGAAGEPPSTILTGTQAFRIDTKIDDGQAASGVVRGAGTDCESTVTPAGGVETGDGGYDGSTSTSDCVSYIRIN